MPANAVVTGADRGMGRALGLGLRRSLAAGAVVCEVSDDDVRADAGARDWAAAAASAGGGGVDVVIVHTAGEVAPGLRMADQVRTYIEANNHTVHRVMAAFEPVLRDGARFVVVSGALGSLDHLPQGLRARFDGPDADLPHLARVLDAYSGAVEDGRAAAEGWPAWIEVASRVGQVAAVRAFARSVAAGPGRGVLVNAVAPGPDDPVGDVLRAATFPAGTREPHGSLIVGRTAVPFTSAIPFVPTGRRTGFSVNSR
ncbi:hypothetical protein [Yinghuangia sp. YIM S09857]|uniref:hypothetical protein n=1 Tax=Yinghuangia sp. YIM S09857 TaxID=3436929 RepID=UPI003F52CB8C